MLAYAPAVMTGQVHDGAGYIRAARRGLAWGDQEPSGYPLFLRVVHAVSHEFAFTIAIQHALGLATGVLLFLAVRRLGGPAWLGLVPAAVVWLGGDQLFLEHAPLSESLFTVLLAATLYAGIRCLDGDWRWPIAAGALSASLLSVRTVGLPIPLVTLVWIAATRWRTGLPARRGVAAGLAATILVAGAYGTLRYEANGRWSLRPQASGWVLYARAAQFADCREFTPPHGTAALCDATPPRKRRGPSYYLWFGGPAHRAFGLPDAHDREVGEFARAAMVHQPLDFLEVAATDLVRYLDPEFGPAKRAAYSGPSAVAFPSGRPTQDAPLRHEANLYYAPTRPQRAGAAEGLRSYQRIARVNGWALLVLLALGVVGAFLARGRVRFGLILLLAVALELLLMPVFTSAEWRYAVPAEGAIACAAAVGGWLAVSALTRIGRPGWHRRARRAA
ncbi:MAG: hypothetical protein QOJ14_1233, partial [Thermoleophilaceae bacterium]|nr:hypothetical protein [Thermoleophilaceae bacterium]